MGLKTKWGFVTLNIGIAIVLAVLLVFAVSFTLRRTTQHGIEIEVPSITGDYIEAARIKLSSKGLRMQVYDSVYIHDSVYNKLCRNQVRNNNGKRPPIIVNQSPLPGTMVKNNRTIYVVSSTQNPLPVILPELRDNSQRKAESDLKRIGLEVDSIIYKQATHQNVLDILYDNQSVAAGQRLGIGSKVTLVVGVKGENEVAVPNLIGKSLDEVRVLLGKKKLLLGKVEYDTESTEETLSQYTVYDQKPLNGMVIEGTEVDIKLSIDRTKIFNNSDDYEEEEEEFF